MMLASEVPDGKEENFERQEGSPEEIGKQGRYGRISQDYAEASRAGSGRSAWTGPGIRHSSRAGGARATAKTGGFVVLDARTLCDDRDVVRAIRPPRGLAQQRPGIMKALTVFALLAVLSIPALADDKPTGPNSGTAPENRGVTGWSGGSRDQKTDEDPAGEARAAADQPWMAEGVDLKSKPRQFSPRKTVE
jgi:hypothetical protein